LNFKFPFSILGPYHLGPKLVGFFPSYHFRYFLVPHLLTLWGHGFRVNFFKRLVLKLWPSFGLPGSWPFSFQFFNGGSEFMVFWGSFIPPPGVFFQFFWGPLFFLRRQALFSEENSAFSLPGQKKGGCSPPLSLFSPDVSKIIFFPGAKKVFPPREKICCVSQTNPG